MRVRCVGVRRVPGQIAADAGAARTDYSSDLLVLAVPTEVGWVVYVYVRVAVGLAWAGRDHLWREAGGR